MNSDHPDHQTDRGSYIPSLDEIARQAAIIRERWSEGERISRLNRHYRNDTPMPQVYPSWETER